VINLLKYHRLSASKQGNSDAERGFSPALREKRNR